MRWQRGQRRDSEPELSGRYHSDARPLGDTWTERAPDPEAEQRLRRRRRAGTLLFWLVFGGGCVMALFADDGLVDLLRLRVERARAEADLLERRARVEVARRAVEALAQDPLAKERIAREKLGLVRPGEMVFLLPKREAGPVPGLPRPTATPGRQGSPAAPVEPD